MTISLDRGSPLGTIGSDDNRPTTVRPVKSISAAKQTELRLLVLLGDDVQTFRLDREGAFIIGRATEAEIQISDSTVSRRHAALVVGPAMSIEDFGSLNGTRVRGKKLEVGERIEFLPGEVVEVGDALLVVQRRFALQQPIQIQKRKSFDFRLDEECARVEKSKTAFAVMVLLVEESLPKEVVDSAIGQSIRSCDLVAKSDDGEYAFLIPNATPAMAETAVRRLNKFLGRFQSGVRWGIACCPLDGKDKATLLARARENLRAEYAAEASGIFVVEDEHMKDLYRLVERIAPSSMNVVLLGETGTGKEVVARLIHKYSRRPQDLFLSVNCAALPETLLESELFGHERGAFTGALRAKPGLLEIAKNGTFLLDEVSEMPVTIQAKLLRMLEERQAVRVGGLKPYRIDARFIATSNRNLEEAVQQGNFRQDLFFRLNGITLFIPPLRERLAELEPLARFFMKQTHRQLGRSGEPFLTEEALAWLKSCRWPGNIRELRNVVERSTILSPDGRITKDLFQGDNLGLPLSSPEIPRLAPVSNRADPTIEMDIREKTGEPRARKFTSVPTKLNQSPRPPPLPQGFKGEVEDLERRRIVEALESTGGNQTEAARLLGVSRRTLINRLEKYGIKRPRNGKAGRQP